MRSIVTVRTALLELRERYLRKELNMSAFSQAIDIIRERANNDTELGTAFEKLSKIFLENDATQTQQYSEVWHYEDWASSREGYSTKDIGIDLVAKLRDEEGYCAIQCKCYQSDHSISKSDLDSFISASSTNDFNRLLLIDTSTQPLGKNAKSVFENLTQVYIRIQLSELEQSRIDWLAYIKDEHVHLHSKKNPLDHQIEALKEVKKGLEEADRGKMIMACGTGKTFTSLRIAEELAGKGNKVLYMVPSLSLMSQTVREWTNDAVEDFTAFSACSDIKVGKRKDSDDLIEINLNDLAFPATTDARKLAHQIENADPGKMTVVFSTYHSIDVISFAQFEHGLAEFDLIICDEAHRTTGATLMGDDESNFVRIHSNESVKGKKRLYMTATPRIYGETAKKKAEEGEVALASMDDKDTFGETLFYRGFGWAVENNLLTDYKVVVLAMDEGIVSAHLQDRWVEGAELKLDDATKMVGCYKALAKVGFKNNEKQGENKNIRPMKRALAFCQNIKVSKMFTKEFAGVVDEFVAKEEIEDEFKTNLKVELDHVDGTFNAEQRNERLDWLSDDIDENICRVLTNVRCLSEGVDVPSLDAILFLHPRKSQIDVVQSVGRVMRKAEGKDLGYVIIPITVAPGVSPEKALNDNEKYKVVWQILNALRAHDERFDSMINRIGLGEDVSDRIEIVGGGGRDELDATTAVVEDVKPKAKQKDNDKNNEDDTSLGDGEEETSEGKKEKGEQLAFVMSDLSQAIKAKIVDKCGTRDYWENWATDIAEIAQAHIVRINAIILNSGTPERKAFQTFLEEIRDDLNPEISESDAVEMLAQHLITKPVFDTLFQGNEFTTENAVSKAMETVLEKLYQNNIDTESGTLNKFYESVKRRAADIITSNGRQKLIIELYDRFFRKAFPAMTQRLGIVYTPIEIVDFILHSVNDVLQDEFGKSLSSKGVHILDPFTGTGTFISRLIQSGLINKKDFARKYKNEIHANEIVLLAYYIASINIESVYQDIVKENHYQPFNGMVLTDTFQLYEQERDMIANLLPDNSNRRTAQKGRDITVLIANPPYSAGQSAAGDNAANIAYPNLDCRIETTYAASSDASLKRKLYDSYIRAIRWASDRVGDEGVIGFVTGAGWIDREFAKGMRKHISEEFKSIYVINLRGDIRKNMLSKGKAGEGENVFGQGSMTGIAIVILVKKPVTLERNIWYYDIGNNLGKSEKLTILNNYASINEVKKSNKFQIIEPDENYNWINKGDVKFNSFLSVGSKKNKNQPSIFAEHSLGISTNRDVWCYNYSANKLTTSCKLMIETFNLSVDKYSRLKASAIKKTVTADPKKIKWSDDLFKYISRGQSNNFEPDKIRIAKYRPFTNTYLYSSNAFNDRQGRNLKFFPNDKLRNLVIATSGIGSRNGLSALMSDVILDLNMLEAGAQCFPLKIYEKKELGEGLFSEKTAPNDYAVTDGITAEGLKRFLNAYVGETFTKEDLFYYVYGLLHSSDYRERFQNNLSKELSRIPSVKRFEDFMTFSKAGRKLGDLHVNYENVEPYPVLFKEGSLIHPQTSDPKKFYRVEKMKYGNKKDKTTVIYNKNLTIQNIPLEAYDYVVNGRSALDWVMDRQCVKTDRSSGIVNDANDYANETMNNPKYPFELFQRVITVSLETMKIVRSLPKLDID
jgi:predicted helicase